ncbi:MAG: sigma 54-interacting transcriptional regulator [Gemmatimonadota bacterium]|nr:sigma 54-interacting transcriptional regulator [Gemmatimonadota bacterium]MDH4347966.1 sigma 54-interacting transcriptional regulator [Gemmatimonadota bacterium]MDH5284221.1 sigma 54-interacting transcriptional regulator [Gemmatimonadota bacterium]
MPECPLSNLLEPTLPGLAGYDLASRFAPLPWPVMILGPTGSGKSVLARAIHRLSGRAGALVECALPAIPGSLRHSIVAGHTRGAFTDARDDRMGVIEQAQGGTLFLDEIGLATPELQELLLGVLESGWVTRIGDSRRRPVNTRFLFATNTDLDGLRRSGQFREDLYWRLGPFTITLPALVQRREEILPLAVALLGESLREAGKPWAPAFGEPAAARLAAHNWPGNLRELRGVCQWAAMMVDADRPAEMADLPPSLGGPEPPTQRRRGTRDYAIRVALERTQGNVSQAARELGISRTTVYRRAGPSGG